MDPVLGKQREAAPHAGWLSPKQEGGTQGTPDYDGTAPKIHHWLPNTDAHMCTCTYMYAQRHTKEEEEETRDMMQRICNPTLRGAKTERIAMSPASSGHSVRACLKGK